MVFNAGSEKKTFFESSIETLENLAEDLENKIY